MGNQNSTNKEENNELKPKSISQILDYIATQYILTLDFKSLRKLYDKEYCDKLVILTSDIIERYFTDLEITYLAQRIKNNVEVNELTKDKVIFFDRDMLDKLDVQNSIKKKRLCISIAKFYIKIAHVFAAIVTTINPIYVYKDTEGNTVRANLYEKSKIPANTPRAIYKLNICDNRIDALKNGHDIVPDEKGNITIQPKICSVNMGENDMNKSLNDEPGIPELMELYYDDNYNYKNGEFTSMTKKSQELFQSNLQKFYNVFTGNPGPLPQDITKFSDIKLKDYHKMEKCQGVNPKYETTVNGPLSESIFEKYANNLKKMIATANLNQKALLSIINQIFRYTIDPQTNKKQIRINPELTEDRLQELVIESRALIIKLYLTCEADYAENVKLYEAIVDMQIFETAKSQIETLEKNRDNLAAEEKLVPEPAELQEIKENAEKKIAKQEQELTKQVTDLKQDEQIIKDNNNPETLVNELNNNSTNPTEKQVIYDVEIPKPVDNKLEDNNVKQPLRM